jgi:hypothetical protein
MHIPVSTGTYAVVTDDGGTTTAVRGGLRHAEAMTLAEELRSEVGSSS